MRALARAAVALGLVVASLPSCSSSGETTTIKTVTDTLTPDAAWVDEPAPPPADAGAATKCPPDVAPAYPASIVPPHPPRAATSACDAGQTTKVTNQCETAKLCGAQLPDELPCAACLFSRVSDATYGYRVEVSGKGLRYNFRGYAIRAGAPTGCGEALERYRMCLEATCECATVSRRFQCLLKAATGACAGDNGKAKTTCGGHPAEALIRPFIEEEAFASPTDVVTMAKAFCGGS